MKKVCDFDLYVIDLVSPKVVVLHIRGNNLTADSVSQQETADAILYFSMGDSAKKAGGPRNSIIDPLPLSILKV